MKRHFENLHLIDLLALSMFLVFVVTWNNNPTHAAFYKMYDISLYVVAYSLLRMFALWNMRLLGRIVSIAIALAALWQITYALLQMLGVYESHNYLYSMTGSFNNPGPFGGFLAVCASILIPCCIKEENRLLKILYALSAVLSLIVMPATLSRTSLLAFGVSMLVYGISHKRIRRQFKRYWMAIVLIISVAATTAYLYKKDSADGRAYINKISLSAIQSNGIKGSGLANYASSYGKAQTEYFAPHIEDILQAKETVKIERERMIADCPAYAFNEYLELGVECGVVGLIIYLLLISVSITTLYREQSVWCYGLIALSIFALFSYPFKMMLFCVMLAFFVAITGIKPGKNRTLFPVYVTFLMALVFVVAGYSRYKTAKVAERSLEKAMTLYDIKYYEAFTEDCVSFQDALLHKYNFMFAFGQSLNKCGEYAKSDSILEMGAAISSDPMFWNVMGNNAKALQQYDRAEECYLRAFNMLPNRLYPLTLLAELYYATGDSCAFIRMKDIVNNFKPKVESVQTEKLREEINSLSFNCYSD